MIDRYSTPEMRKIWSDETKYEIWLQVEILAAEAYRQFNSDITAEDIEKLWANAKVNVPRIEELEVETKHDIIAFTRQISETLGEEKKWIHYGLTSTDVVDTAQSYRLKLVNEIIEKDLVDVISLLKELALKYENTFQMGRTHGIHAEVSTFGYKLALWYDEMNRNLKRFHETRKNIEVAKISGAVGNYANIPLEIQEYIAKKMGLHSSFISTQTLQRDRHAEYIFVISLIATSLDKFSTEIRHLQRTEVGEVEEGFAKGQKGSSAMPHKRNPISSENISGQSRLLRGFVVTALENVALWHERDISHSSNERAILPDATATLDYILKRFLNVLKNLQVNEEKMLSNIYLTQKVFFSQRCMLHLIENLKWSREKAYDTIQPIALEALKTNQDFEKLLITKGIFTSMETQKLFDLEYYVKNIDLVFRRLELK